MSSDSTLITLAVRPGETSPRVSSLQIAEAFEKDHKNVLAKINELVGECPSDFGQLNFQPANYLDAQGKSREQFLLTRDGFSLLVMGFTGAKALAWKVRYIEAFNEMERRLLRRRLEAAARLTPERRRVLKKAARYRSQGLSYTDVGKLLDVSRDTASALVADAAALEVEK